MRFSFRGKKVKHWVVGLTAFLGLLLVFSWAVSYWIFSKAVDIGEHV
jgi:hypothetical protein